MAESASEDNTQTLCAVIPTFNRAQYLARLLKSLEAQDFGPFCIAICNDASSDETSKVVSEWSIKSRHRILYCENDQNLGPAQSFMNAVSLTDAKFLIALGDDDLLDSRFVSRMATIARSHPNVVAVFARDKSVKSSLELLRTRLFLGGSHGEGAIGIAHLMAGNPITGPGALFIREVLEAHPMHPANIYAQDFELWLSLALRGRVVHSNVSIRYGKTPGSLNRSPGVAHELDLGLTIRRFLTSDEFQDFVERQTVFTRKKLIRSILFQLLLMGRNTPLALKLAIRKTSFESKRLAWSDAELELVDEILVLHGSGKEWQLERRKLAIAKMETLVRDAELLRDENLWTRNRLLNRLATISLNLIGLLLAHELRRLDD